MIIEYWGPRGSSFSVSVTTITMIMMMTMRQHHDLDKPLGLLSAPRTRAQLQNEGFEAKETNKCPLLLQNVATSQ